MSSSARTPPRRGELKKQLYRLAVARSDVTQALGACELLRREVKALGDDLYQPLFHAIAISYSKPFVVSRAGSTIGDRWAKFTNPAFVDTHKRLLELRHKFVAHSDQVERTVQIIPAGVPLYEGGQLHFTKPGVGVRDLAYPLEWFDLVAATTHDLGSRLNAEVERLLEELYGARDDLPTAAFPLAFDDDL